MINLQEAISTYREAVISTYYKAFYYSCFFI